MRIQMSVKLARRKGSQSWYIKGVWRGQRIFESTGTGDKELAKTILQKREAELVAGERRGHTFSGAVISYRQAGYSDRFLAPLVIHFKDRPLSEINQAAVDEAAVVLYPEATASTRSRQVHTPMSAVLRHAGVKLELRRPKGASGKPRTSWLAPEQAFALLASAEALQTRFGAFCTLLLYTGCRLSEGLRLEWADVDLANSIAYIKMTKNGEPRTVFLPEPAVAALAGVEGERSGRIFPWHKGQRLNNMFHDAAKSAGLTIEGVSFHIFRHTYGAWGRKYGGLDTSGLVATGAWKSRQAAAVYEHVDVSEEAKKAALFPVRRKS